MDDDLNTAEALAAIFEYVRAINTAIDQDRFCEENRWEAAKVLEVFDGVFDVLKPYDRSPVFERRPPIRPRPAQRRTTLTDCAGRDA